MIGQKISHYRILERLGEGAAGTVYKAENLFNQTIVAIKILHPHCLQDESRHERFLREAKAATSIDHSSIGQVFDYQEDDGHAFQVMRFYEGGSLRKRLRGQQLPLEQAVLIAIQIAEGLEAVHQQGIVHRDIKPANLMIAQRESSSDGLGQITSSVDPESTVQVPESSTTLIEEIKITDFGLALLPDHTRLTKTGASVGTPAYMAPEQVRGDTLDQRTDLWSLGAVLYEMVTGTGPFKSDSIEGLTHAIKERDPVPVREARPEASPQLAWIIEKALHKKPNDRYDSATEMLGDLRTVRDQLQGKKKRRFDWDTWIVENRGRLLFAGFGLTAVAAAIVFGPVFFNGNGPSPHGIGQPVKLTSGAIGAGAPCISPDGTRVAYTSRFDDNQEIAVVSIRGGEPLRLTHHSAADTEPAWLPDGSGLLFASDRLGNSAIWKIGQMGGDAIMFVDEGSHPAVSLDGQWIAFCGPGGSGDDRVFVAPLADPQAARQLTHDGDGPGSHRSPAWSPDGKQICYGTMHELWLVDVASASATQLMNDGGYNTDPSWSPGSKHIYYTSLQEGTYAISWVEVKGRRTHRLTPGSGPESHPSVSRDGQRLVYTTLVEDEDIVIVSRTNGTEFCLDGVQDDFQATISSDNAWLAYVSRRWGKQNDLWVHRLRDGRPDGQPVRLTDQPGRAAYPAFSPDGRWLAYYRVLDQERDIWIVPVAGGQPRRITQHPGDDVHPCWSPDGGQIAFASEREGTSSIWTLPVADGERRGEPRLVTVDGLPALFPAWSPDGAWIAFLGYQEDQVDTWIVPANGSAPPRQLTSGVGAQRVRWDKTSGDLWVSGTWDSDRLCLRRVSPTDGTVRSLDPPFLFHRDTVHALFDIGAQGELVVFSRPKLEGNIWVLEAKEGVY